MIIAALNNLAKLKQTKKCANAVYSRSNIYIGHDFNQCFPSKYVTGPQINFSTFFEKDNLVIDTFILLAKKVMSKLEDRSHLNLTVTQQLFPLLSRTKISLFFEKKGCKMVGYKLQNQKRNIYTCSLCTHQYC